MFNGDYTIRAVDPELWDAIQAENEGQHNHIELIASENYASPAVMEAQGSQLTNKYAERYVNRRYYWDCEFVDAAEQLAIDRVRDCSARNTPTFNRTQTHRPTRPST